MAQATILEWDPYLANQEPDEIRGLVGWLGALRRAGILSHTPDGLASPPFLVSIRELADHYGARHLDSAVRLILDTWVPGFLPEFGYGISGYWSRSHLAVVPLPAAPAWPPRVRRLADMSLLPLIDRRFWESGRHVTSLDVAPLVLCHAIRQPARWGRLPGERSAAQTAYDRARASMAWFREIELPAAAEVVLAEFIDNCLAGPPTNPGAPRGPSAPSRPGAPAPGSPGWSWDPTPQPRPALAG